VLQQFLRGYGGFGKGLLFVASAVFSLKRCLTTKAPRGRSGLPRHSLITLAKQSMVPMDTWMPGQARHDEEGN
jgi:hypothetical protein